MGTSPSTVTPKLTAAQKREAELDKRIENILHDKLAHFLSDIDFRIGQANAIVDRAGSGPREGKVYAEDLNLLGRAMLTGYTVTNNSPAAGSFAWANLHVVYNGIDTTITDGNTANKYVWWSSVTTPTVLQSGNVKPTLAAGEVLLFMNVNGTPQVMLSDTNASMPGVLRDGAVDSGAIIANAVGSAAIANNAVTQAQLGPNAVTATEIADGAVIRSGQLAANVVTSGALADGAVVRTGQLAANVVTATKVADGAINRAGMLSGTVVATGNLQLNAVTSAQLADGAVVRSGQLAGNVVTSTALADGAVVRAGQLAANVVTTTQIADNAVTASELSTGSVTATKMNVLRHFIF